MENSKTEISLSKVKLSLLIFGCLLFVALGLFMIIKSEAMQTRKFGPIWIQGFGTTAVLFFGGIGISVFKKLFDNKPGLVVDDVGVLDNSSGVSVGLILWKDVLDLRRVNVSGTKFLLIDVRNPDEYIDRAKGGVKKRTMKLNNRRYGTPISISANGLGINFTKMEGVIINAFESYKLTN